MARRQKQDPHGVDVARVLSRYNAEAAIDKLKGMQLDRRQESRLTALQKLQSDVMPWERQDSEDGCEGDREFSLFCSYRDQPSHSRDLESVIEAFPDASGDEIVGLYGKWSWDARARAWDDELDRNARLENVDAARVRAKQNARAANTLREMALAHLSGIDPSEITPKTAIEMLNAANAIDRDLARQEGTGEEGKATVHNTTNNVVALGAEASGNPLFIEALKQVRDRALQSQLPSGDIIEH